MKILKAEAETPKRLRQLTDELKELQARLRLGGGPDKIERQHQQGKLTARERIELLLDKGSYHQEIGLLVAYDQYDGGAPGAGVVTVVGRVNGREVVVVANDATVKAGSWWPETIKKILRAQEIAMRTRSEEHTSELQSQSNLVCRLLLEKKKDPIRAPRASR